MYQFKAIVSCPDCGEIHAEKWLTSNNRHASQTVLYTLCESCQFNELVAFDPFADNFCPTCQSNECKGHLFEIDEDDIPADYFVDVPTCEECGHVVGAHFGDCSQFDPMENEEYYHNGGYREVARKYRNNTEDVVTDTPPAPKDINCPC
jgi:hypothetical protein